MTISLNKIVIMVLAATLVTACATTTNRLNSPEQYGQKVEKQLADGDLRAAESTLGEMELYYPVSTPTQALQLKLIAAYYKAAELDRTVVAANRYASMFPKAGDVDQAYYYAGMANYDRGLRYLSENSQEKSPLHAKAAKESFTALLRCCADSHYATEANERLSYLDEALAQYEFSQMRADLLDGNKTAAIAKGNYILDAYPTTTAAGVATVMLAAMDKPEVLDRLLIATALLINQDEAEAIAEKAGMDIDKPVAVASAGEKGTATATSAVATVAQAAEKGAVVAAGVTAGAAQKTPAAVATAAPKDVQPVAEVLASRTMVTAKMAPGAKRYTVQLGSSRKLVTVQRYIRRLGLAEMVAYEQRMVNGEPWYAASYGVYPSIRAAQHAADDLAQRTGVKDLWVRRLGDVPVEPSSEPRSVMASGETAKARRTAAKERGKYSIQVASAQSLDSLKEEMQELKLDGIVQYHRRMVDNKVIYSALFGEYNDMQSAQADLPSLEDRLHRTGLWVRPMSESEPIDGQ